MLATLKEAAKQVPNLVCCIVIVFLFLRYLEKERSHINELNNKAIRVVEENSKVVRENIEVLGEVKEALHDFKNYQKFKSTPSS